MTAPAADVLGDLLARERRSNRPALRASGRELDYRRFITTAWKAGNYLRHLGTRPGSTVGVVGRSPEAASALFGAVALGASVRSEPSSGEGLDALVAPTGRLDGFDTPGRSRRIGYGADPEDPAVSYFERDVWSENPVEPPERVSPEDPALDVSGTVQSHADVLAAARTAVEKAGMGPEDTVALRVPLSAPGAVAAGLVAPLLVGACVLFPGEGAGDADAETGTVAVAEGVAPESRTVAPR
jgi:hypothetical protein